jgi:hypothetical protein
VRTVAGGVLVAVGDGVGCAGGDGGADGDLVFFAAVEHLEVEGGVELLAEVLGGVAEDAGEDGQLV